jgi:hypothetical protein
MEDRFCQKCDCELAEYEYNGKDLCDSCLVEYLEENEEIESYTTTNYAIGGEYIGTDDDMQEVIDNLIGNFDIKEIEINE